MTTRGGVILGAPVRSLPSGPQGIGQPERRELVNLVGRSTATSITGDVTLHFGRLRVGFHPGEVAL